MLDLIKQTFREFMDDDAPRLAAALSYYTVFALPPLLVLLIVLLGAVFEPSAVEQAMEGQVRSTIGAEAADAIQTMIENASRPGSGGLLATLLSIAALLFGASGAFAQLQRALNTAWGVEPDPESGGVMGFISKRVLSLGMILAVGFLLVVFLVVSAVLSAVGESLTQFLPSGLSGALLQALNAAISLAVITVLFAAIFKVLPDAVIRWKDVWMGAAVTALLFVVGKFALGFYISRSDPGSAYGAAGSLAVILVWIYFSSMIVLLGAEFTQVWARRKGQRVEPEEGAVRVRKAPDEAVPRGAV
ncbi:MAG TPA: YihY/virulence factor BrkB family protein [Longimicrobiales bacterium]|nr:YihY/virulence factor BrkB family protein [Longimicrobiales bacterium]